MHPFKSIQKEQLFAFITTVFILFSGFHFFGPIAKKILIEIFWKLYDIIIKG
jgi:hypothetical protein